VGRGAARTYLTRASIFVGQILGEYTRSYIIASEKIRREMKYKSMTRFVAVTKTRARGLYYRRPARSQANLNLNPIRHRRSRPGLEFVTTVSARALLSCASGRQANSVYYWFLCDGYRRPHRLANERLLQDSLLRIQFQFQSRAHERTAGEIFRDYCLYFRRGCGMAPGCHIG